MTTTTPGSRPTYGELETSLAQERAENTSLKNSTRKKVGAGFLGGGVTGAIITALLMQSCYGTKTITPTTQNIPDCKSAAPVIVNNYCGNSGSGNPHDWNKNQTPGYDNKTCPEGQSCYENGLAKKLAKCLDENEELRKRPKHCPKYTPTTPQVCPQVKKCPELPYIRRGE